MNLPNITNYISEDSRITFINHRTVNYIGLTDLDLINNESYNVGSHTLNIGDKIIKLGTKKRSKFEMQEGHYLEYSGYININNIIHIIFASDGIREKIDGYYIFYSFALVKPNIFIIGTGKGCKDIRIDEIFYYEENLKTELIIDTDKKGNKIKREQLLLF